MKKKTKRIKIEFANWIGKAALEIEANSVKEAVEKAVANNINLSCADLSGASLSGASLSGASLSGASLSGASLRNTDLSDVDLRYADLSCADLSGASLSGASLSGASLSGASLSGASLRRASLRNTDLSDVDLRYADLSDVDLRYADLSGATYNGKKLWSLRPVVQLDCCGSASRSTLVMFYADKSEPMVYCGCFSGTIDEFEKKIHHRHAGTFHEYEYMAMVEHIRAIWKYQLEVKDEN